MTDVSELIKKVFHLTADEEGEVREDHVIVKWDLLFTIGKTLEAQAAEIEDLKTRLAGCRAGFDRLARQVDGYKRAGKLAIDQLRKKT